MRGLRSRQVSEPVYPFWARPERHVRFVYEDDREPRGVDCVRPARPSELALQRGLEGGVTTTPDGWRLHRDGAEHARRETFLGGRSSPMTRPGRRRSRDGPASTSPRSSGSTATRRRTCCHRHGPRRSPEELARIHTYPHGGYPRLEQAIADYAGVSPENIVLGAGADDLILLVTRAFACPGDRVAIANDPTYPMFQIAVWVAGAEIDDHDPALTICCRPNNPTGELGELPIARPLVVDEAYFEYCGRDGRRPDRRRRDRAAHVLEGVPGSPAHGWATRSQAATSPRS